MIGIGVDVVEIERFRRSLERTPTMRERLFTSGELEALADEFNDMAARLRASYADLEGRVEERTRELSEALGREQATTQILRVISRSPTDLQPVFDAILDNAIRICDAQLGNLVLLRGDAFELVAIAREGGQKKQGQREGHHEA